MADNLLEIKGLKTYFYTEDGIVRALEGIDLHIEQGETLGLVGESGCGKTVTALSVLRLVPDPPGKIIEGEILFEGVNLLALSESDMRQIRGNDISMIFQDPQSALNPVFTVDNQLREVIELHQGLDKKEARQKAIEMLDLVGIPDPEARVEDYPHQFSGGMKQRVMIAMALSCNPKMLIADEPTTNLDVTVQAQVLDMINNLRKELGTTVLLITHNLGVIAEMSDHVGVMYAGRLVEYGDADTIFHAPLHPYTIALHEAVPRVTEKKQKLGVIKGVVPNLIYPPSGCRFHPRCDFSTEVCEKEQPKGEWVGDHYVECWHRREGTKL
ncbi:MAG: ABC transporter ATP-binding protein [Theionarchaea archaeon]|nr:ABC transporter ATP-binding protein [Theionarchaea archaeon]MBU7034695.1 ABC transporter ATP-binding protein [Theionarchaea archaeon]MBU7039356.1 ABC transporter ATP-binding protein [Theionarchaea archaeon]